MQTSGPASQPTYIGTNAERLALAPSALPQLVRFIEWDTHNVFVWEGIGWVANGTDAGIPVNIVASSYGAFPVYFAGGNYFARYGSLPAAATSTTITFPSGYYFRKLVMELSADATFAVAGRALVTATVGSTIVYEQNIYVPSVMVAGLGGITL